MSAARCYRVAFYAPLKSPCHAVPSGDREIARYFMRALSMQGHMVELVSRFRSFEGHGDQRRQQRIEHLGNVLGQRLLRTYQRRAKAHLPDCWFTYHSYHKAPDWLGPEVAAQLKIPYVVAEASVAPVQQGGCWGVGHQRAVEVVRIADRIIHINSADKAAVLASRRSTQGMVELPPFLNPALYSRASKQRASLAGEYGLAQNMPWLLCASMMRSGRKQRSFEVLAASLAEVADQPWLLLIAGDGPASAAVHTAFDKSGIYQRVCFLGLLNQAAMINWMQAADWFVWPAIDEPLGMAMLEAQAAGLPVIASQGKGVANVVCHNHSGWLVDQPAAFANVLRMALANPTIRSQMSRNARSYIDRVHSIKSASERLTALLHDVCDQKNFSGK